MRFFVVENRTTAAKIVLEYVLYMQRNAWEEFGPSLVEFRPDSMTVSHFDPLDRYIEVIKEALVPLVNPRGEETCWWWHCSWIGPCPGLPSCEVKD